MANFHGPTHDQKEIDPTFILLDTKFHGNIADTRHDTRERYAQTDLRRARQSGRLATHYGINAGVDEGRQTNRWSCRVELADLGTYV